MSERSDSHVPEPLLHQGAHLPQARTYDLALFRELQAEYLQAEYRDTAPAVDHDGPAARAERRADEVVRRLGDPAGARVLEIGCGEGRLSQLLVERHGCEVVGIDTVAHEEWSDRPGADLRRHDLPSGERTSLGRFDLIVSFGTWERLAHPYAALEEARALLADGGRMLLHAGLYRGPSGAGVAPDVAFPWPHLLFTDEVIADHRRQDLGVEPGAAWVNRLTTTHYTTYAERVGLRAADLWHDRTPLDRAFYERFSDRLGRYPVFDLERDAIGLVLDPAEPVPHDDDPPDLRDLETLRRRAAKLERQRDRARRRVRDLEGSRSWRVTAPLRRITRNG